jgi:uncharacterized protein (DUF2336 family)
MPGTKASKVALMQARYERLLAEPSPAVRAEAAAGVASEFAGEALSDSERRIALDILEVMARDVERQVRQALSEHVKHCPFLPPSIARTLAEDVESVALPIIEYSSVLSDQDLIAIVRRGSEAKQVAVAKRDDVTAEVSEALVDSGSEKAVGTLLANHRAEISEGSLFKVLDGFPETEEIQALVVERPMLPLTVCERLISSVSQDLREHVIARHELPPQMADDLMLQGRERALTQVLAEGSRIAEVIKLANRLHAKDALTATLMLRALCVCDLDFFQAAMAARTRIPFENAGILAFDEGRAGLEAIYGRAGLPDELFAAFRSAVDVIKDISRENRPRRRLEITERILDRLRMEYDTVCPEGLEHTLAQLSHLVAKRSEGAARGLARSPFSSYEQACRDG